MSRISVDTSALHPAAARLSGIGDELAGVRQALSRVEAAGGASGSEDVAGAVAAFSQSWSGALSTMRVGANALGQTLGASATAYDTTDRTQFRGAH